MGNEGSEGGGRDRKDIGSPMVGEVTERGVFVVMVISWGRRTEPAVHCWHNVIAVGWWVGGPGWGNWVTEIHRFGWDTGYITED